MSKPLVLSYSGCSTCKKALRWLADQEVLVDVRAIVDKPPTTAELTKWIAASGVPVRKWLNTSGQSYRAIGKATIDAASEKELVAMLVKDGKLVKRPVLVAGNHVLVGFQEQAYREAFAR
jgi:arsenate reductase (glutaredoxin)